MLNNFGEPSQNEGSPHLSGPNINDQDWPKGEGTFNYVSTATARIRLEYSIKKKRRTSLERVAGSVGGRFSGGAMNDSGIKRQERSDQQCLAWQSRCCFGL